MSVHTPEEQLLGFAAALRAAGVHVTTDRAQSFVQAVSLVGFDDATSTWLAGRATLCAGPEDLVRYDRVFEAWWLERAGLPQVTQAPPATVSPRLPTETDEAEGSGDQDEDVLRVAASDTEILRHRDVAELSSGDKARLDALLARLQVRSPQRRAVRRTPSRRGDLDADRTLRRTLRQLGEPDRIAWRHRGTRPRRVVLLVDVSGSMTSYADALLRLAHRVTSAHPATEVFTLGTRLTRITAAMRQRDAEQALVAAGHTVPDWSGGTRLGETLKVFLDRWGQRGLARGAVVVIFSDGWERGDAVLLGEQAARLHRLAHRVVWVNPHRGKAGYEPVQQGIVAVLDHVDDFVAGHSLATYARLCEVIARA